VHENALFCIKISQFLWGGGYTSSQIPPYPSAPLFKIFGSATVSFCSGLAAILKAMLLPEPSLTCAELPRRILVFVLEFDILNRFFSRPELGWWPWDVGGTVGAPQQQLRFLFFRRRLHSCTPTGTWWSKRYWKTVGLYFLLAWNKLASTKVCNCVTIW